MQSICRYRQQSSIENGDVQVFTFKKLVVDFFYFFKSDGQMKRNKHSQVNFQSVYKKAT